jgi:hypothetical protein
MGLLSTAGVECGRDVMEPFHRRCDHARKNTAMPKNNEDVLINVSKTKARGGVTGHNVRYVLAFGLVGVVIASSPSLWTGS